MDEILDYLARAEGTKLHYNDGEVDVTAPYGIYRYAHRNAEIFDYIDRVAGSIGVVGDSTDWHKHLVEKVDSMLDSRVIRELAGKFYSEYLSGAKLDMFPSECRVAMMSMYTNSPKLAWKAVQRTLIALQRSGYLRMQRHELSSVDGSYGIKTGRALIRASKLIDPMYLETLMLFKMLCEYVELGNEKYLNGWKNRLDLLTELK